MGGTTRKTSLVPLRTGLFFFFEKKEDTDHMDMQEQLRKIQEEATSQLESIRDKAGLDALRLKTLGKKGDLTLMLRSSRKRSLNAKRST